MKKSVVLVCFLLSPLLVLAHGVEESGGLRLLDLTSLALALAAVLVIVAVVLSLFVKKTKKNKRRLFFAILIPVVVASVFLAVATVYTNVTSQTGGPVHWHADFELWACGEPVALADPVGLSNKVGSPLFHEHDDNRLHVEGVVEDEESVTLHHFFELVGGQLEEGLLVVPTEDGPLALRDGDLCGGVPGKVQAFVYRVVDPSADVLAYEQEKLGEPGEYLLSPFADVPPGDCVIIEFGEDAPRTDHLCESYRIAEREGDILGG